MSHISAEAISESAASPRSAEPSSSEKSELTPEAVSRLVARASDIISGRVVPPSMTIPPEVKAILDKDFRDRNPPPTAKAYRYHAERMSLDFYYRGERVACFENPDGSFAVLGSGEREIKELLRGLPKVEANEVLILTTEPF